MSQVISLNEARSARMSDSKPALEDGYTRIVNPVLEKMMSFPLTSMEQRMVLAIARKTYGYNKGKDRIAACQLAELMSSPEQRITRQKASTVLSGLIRKQVVIREGGSQAPIKINSQVEQWHRPEKATKAPENPNVNRNCESTDENGSVNRKTVRKKNCKTVHTKDKKDIVSNPSDYLSEPAQSEPDSSPTVSADDSPGKPPKKPKHLKKPVPFNDIVDLYHEILPGNPEFIDWTPTREGQMRARWNQRIGRNKEPCNSLEFWRRFFEYVAQSDFLCGRVDPKPGRKRFVADLEWLTKASNFMRIIERRYHDNGGSDHGKTGSTNSGSASKSGVSSQLTDLEYAKNNF